MLYTFYANAPSRFQTGHNLSNLRVQFRDLVRNCEDAVLDPEHGFALLSCDPGRDTWNTVMGVFQDPESPPATGIYYYDYTSGSTKPEKLALLDFNAASSHFHPLGLDYHAESNTVFVTNHARDGPSIEVFTLFQSDRAATHIRTIKDGLLAAPNSIAALNSHEFLVTNDHHFRAGKDAKANLLETYLGLPGGSVVHVDLRLPSQANVTRLARLPFANGIVQLNATTWAVASSSMNSIYLYDLPSRNGDHVPALELSSTIAMPFHPDNLSIDKDGKLLIAGHPHSPTLGKISKNIAQCNSPGGGKEGDCVQGLSWIAEWGEQGGLTTLYKGRNFGTSSTAVRDVDRRFGLAIGLYERGLLTWDA